MDNLLCLTLEAHNPEHNHHRSYTITVGRDLLNMWTVSIRHGCVGQFGRERSFASEDPEGIGRIIRRHLSRRLSAPKRIECAYSLQSIDSSGTLVVADWLPSDVLSKFQQDRTASKSSA